MPIGFSSDSDSVVITYGETTEENHDYLDVVNDFFTNHAHVNVKNTNNKIITAKNVNDLFSGYINNHYVSLKKSWYYNTEIKWYTSSNGTRSINVNFK